MRDAINTGNDYGVVYVCFERGEAFYRDEETMEKISINWIEFIEEVGLKLQLGEWHYI